eukprot:434778-Rhodomonas_salina.1
MPAAIPNSEAAMERFLCTPGSNPHILVSTELRMLYHIPRWYRPSYAGRDMSQITDLGLLFGISLLAHTSPGSSIP